ncbi:DUF4400 domain-containing protein [Serratia fonticola]
MIATAFTTLTFLVRQLVRVLTLPLFMIAAFIGFVNGLERRDMKKFGAGCESAFAKDSLMPFTVLPWLI